MVMQTLGGFIERFGLAMAGKSPWGKGPTIGGSGGDDGDGGDSPSSGEDRPRGPRNPWLPGGGSGSDKPRRSASIEDIFKNRGPEGPRRMGGGGPGGPGFKIPQRPGGKSWFPVAVMGIVGLWILVSSVHQIAPREQAVVTWMGGKYSTTLDSGLKFTLPWPIQVVDKENVSQIRSVQIPDGSAEKLILTGDQNLVDLSYRVRWNISDLTLFRYQLEEPDETMSEVAEAMMRAAVAQQELDTVLTGAGRAEIEQEVMDRMQRVLDAYKSGIAIQGVDILKTDPPSRVEEAFKDVSSAQQDADAAMNRARQFSQELLARAQGDAAEFNNLYAEYRLAPEVTRRRLYYETMESVLRGTDKTVIEGGSGVTPYLPLPEVRRRAQQSSGAQVVTPPAPQQGGQ